MIKIMEFIRAYKNEYPYLSLKKYINEAKYKIDIKKRRITTASFPPQITFQASAYCNSNCRLCPVGFGIKRSKLGFLPYGLFKKNILDLKGLLKKFILQIGVNLFFTHKFLK